MRILLIALEFNTWRSARHLSYCAQLAFEEGLESHGIEYFTITTPWLGRIREILNGRQFDQVWVELVHSNFNENLLDWISQLAPIRIGFILESLNYSTEEKTFLPLLKERKIVVARKIKYMTHVVACDENDVDDLNNTSVQTFWWPQAVPLRFIGTTSSKKSNKYATFSGALYGNRASFLNHPALQNLLMRQPSSEKGTYYPALFNLLHGGVLLFSKTSFPINNKSYSNYLRFLRYIRQNCFSLWLNTIQSGCAVVNLPHFVKTYPGRVVEAMAAERPVISWEIPNRPKNKALFHDNHEILFFDKNNPQQLAVQIRRIQSDHNFSQRITQNALKKIKAFHTIEKRVEQIIKWIKNGQQPYYG